MKYGITALVAALVGANATELTPDTWDAAVAGKTVLIKFQAPWCGHCKRMKPAFDKLMKEYEGHATAGVFDVDCTAAGKPLCDSNGVRGFPTIKYGDPNSLEAYEGGRDYDSLLKFCQENLKPVCSPANIELCDEAQTANINKFTSMTDAELAALIKAGADKKSDAEKTFKDEVSKLQKNYEALTAAKEAALEEVDNSGVSTAKAVQAHKATAAKDEL